MEDPEALRAKAEQARRLASGVGSTADRLQLTELANALAAKAIAAEAERSAQRQEDQSSPDL
jgi:hypothetical protein